MLCCNIARAVRLCQRRQAAQYDGIETNLRVWDLGNVSSNGRSPAQHRDEEAKRAPTNSRKDKISATQYPPARVVAEEELGQGGDCANEVGVGNIRGKQTQKHVDLNPR